MHKGTVIFEDDETIQITKGNEKLGCKKEKKR